MSYPINYPTPQGANIQIFQAGENYINGITPTTDQTVVNWVKPQGASFVWFTLIGAGGGGSSTTSSASDGAGGGSGAVTNFMGPAFLMPDVLRVYVGQGGDGGASNTAGSPGTATKIVYQQKDGTGYTLLTANAGTGATPNAGAVGVGGTATASNYFSAMGFYQSIAGQNGSVGSASSTTFLSGGGVATSSANYGYVATDPYSGAGYFQMQPIIVGVGGGTFGSGSDIYKGGNGGVGCGGGGISYINASSVNKKAGNGGNGLVVIITW